MPELFAYTDGACSGNPGPGGWGALLIARDGEAVLKERELNGGEALTTNNRMELLAAIAALEALERPIDDHGRDRFGLCEERDRGLDRGLEAERLEDGGPQAREERGPLAPARRGARPPPGPWEWIKGHAGHPENERADELARAGMKPFKPKKAAG
jgi:ribonuclease HI